MTEVRSFSHDHAELMGSSTGPGFREFDSRAHACNQWAESKKHQVNLKEKTT